MLEYGLDSIWVINGLTSLLRKHNEQKSENLGLSTCGRIKFDLPCFRFNIISLIYNKRGLH